MTHFSSLTGVLAFSAGVLLAAPNASAQMQMQMPMHDHSRHATPVPAQDDADAMADGEVKFVDKSAGTLTIQHGPLTNLNMPGMTMAFNVQDPAMLGRVKAGDKIRLRVEFVNDVFTVTRLEAAN